MDYLKLLAKRILKYQAVLVLNKYKPKIIAITGSVGKTLAKESIYQVLSKSFFVRKSEKSFTAELGVSMTIIGCPDGVGSIFQFVKNIILGLRIVLFKTKYPEWLILEIDGDKPGDLGAVSSIIKPDILVITAIGDVPAHIETFVDMEEFLSEKKTMVDSVRFGGVVIYNSDDAVSTDLARIAKVRSLSIGIGNGYIRGGAPEIIYGIGKSGSVPTGVSFSLNYKNTEYSLKTFDTLGIQNEYALLFAFAVGIEFGLEAKQLVQVLGKYQPLPGRMRLLPGIKDSIVIDDSYNSSPLAISEAIKVLGNIKSVDKKIAVIGDMLELGKFSAVEHRKVSQMLYEVATHVVCVGIRSRKIVEELLNRGFNDLNIISFDDSGEAGKYVQNLISEGDIVLVKGSQSMRMEKVVEEIMRHPEDKKKLLVRQEGEWLDR